MNDRLDAYIHKLIHQQGAILIGTAGLADGAVTSAKILDGTIAAGDLSTVVAQGLTTICTSATRPGSPYVGQVIWETDNVTFSIWDGTEWRRSASVPSGTTQTGTFGGGGTTSSTTYVDTPGPVDVSFTKRADASALEVDIFGTAYAGGAGTLAKLGFSISGTDYDCCKYYFNAGGDHRFFAGKAKLAGIPKTATSLRLRWSTSTGVALNADNNDFYWCQVMEMR